MVLKQYIQDVNDIIMEYHIVEDINFQGGVEGTTVVLLYWSNILEKCIAKQFKSSVVRSQLDLSQLDWRRSRLIGAD